MADKIDHYMAEMEKLKAANKQPDVLYKNFDNIHAKEILDNLGLTRYCCRRHMISNVDLMHII
jgi:DNA-directed RNA polymerase subunit N (RpoN/RPB10)